MVSAPVMAGKFGGFSHKKLQKMKHTKVAPIVAVKPLPTTKPMEPINYRAEETADWRQPAALEVRQKAEFKQVEMIEPLTLKRAAP